MIKKQKQKHACQAQHTIKNNSLPQYKRQKQQAAGENLGFIFVEVRSTENERGMKKK